MLPMYKFATAPVQKYSHSFSTQITESYKNFKMQAMKSYIIPGKNKKDHMLHSKSIKTYLYYFLKQSMRWRFERRIGTLNIVCKWKLRI